jgi:hypothetical protein
MQNSEAQEEPEDLKRQRKSLTQHPESEALIRNAERSEEVDQKRKRKPSRKAKPLENVEDDPHGKKPLALSFSGGGIRSACFSAGAFRARSQSKSL